MKPTIAIGSDHAGYEMKTMLRNYLETEGYAVADYGTVSADSVDYPDFAHAVASAVEEGTQELGVLLCGSANGVAMTANKHAGIRAGIAWRKDIAELARQHNNANILCLPARYLSETEAIDCLNGWLHAEFEGGRHERRTAKIPC